MSNLRGSTDEQVRANRVTAATLRLERVVDELDQSFRGFVLTRNSRIRESWERASVRADAGDGDAGEASSLPSREQSRARPRAIVHGSTSYVTDYGKPLISIALESPAAAHSPAASNEGLTRIGQIRRGLASLLAREDRLASEHASRARSRANQAVLIGVVALGASCVVLLLVIGYLVRSVAHPVRDVASGAARIAAGDFSIRIPPDGPAEIRELTTAFNSMAGSVEQGRRNLERQNEQLRAERAGQVGADHDRLPRAAEAAREHPRLHEPDPAPRHEPRRAAPLRGDHPRPGPAARRAGRGVPLGRGGRRADRARVRAGRPRVDAPTRGRAAPRTARTTTSWSSTSPTKACRSIGDERPAGAGGR